MKGGGLRTVVESSSSSKNILLHCIYMYRIYIVPGINNGFVVLSEQLADYFLDGSEYTFTIF